MVTASLTNVNGKPMKLISEIVMGILTTPKLVRWGIFICFYLLWRTKTLQVLWWSIASAAKIIQILLHYPDSASKKFIVYEKRW